MRKLRITLALALTFPLYFAAGWMPGHPFADEWETYAKELLGRR